MTFSSDYCSPFRMSLEWQTYTETVTTKTQASKWRQVGHFVIVMYEMALLHTADLEAGKHKSICRIRENRQFGSWSPAVRISRNLGNNHRFMFNWAFRHNLCIISASFNPQAPWTSFISQDFCRKETLTPWTLILSSYIDTRVRHTKNMNQERWQLNSCFKCDVRVNLPNTRLYTVVCDEIFINGAPKRGSPLPKAKFKNAYFVEMMISGFYVICGSASIIHRNQLMTSTLEYWKIYLTKTYEYNYILPFQLVLIFPVT
jgi:hypothetical protein